MLHLILLGLIVLLSCKLFNRSKLSLPGPTGLPIVGYEPFIGDAPHLTYVKLAEKYGPIFKVKLGSTEWLILNGTEAIKEAFITNRKATSGRPHNAIMTAVAGEKSLTFTTDMHSWKHQRSFGTKALKSYGTPKMEDTMRMEAEFLCQSIAERKGRPTECQRTIVKAVCNVACLITVGRRYKYTDEEYEKILIAAEILSGGTNIATRLAKIMKANFFRYLPGYKDVYNYCISAYVTSRKEIASHIEEHKRTLMMKDHTRDMMDEFLVEIAKRGYQDEVFTEKQLPITMQTVISASTDTTTNTIRWCIVGLTTNQAHQAKIYKEVADVLESRSHVSMEDQLNMPYTRAYLQELTRFCVPSPLLIPHCATEDFMLCGYKIPKDTPIFANVWSVHRSPTLFENPDEFRPERFLDAEGKFVHCDDLMAFSIGPRRCIGEQLARSEVFLFLAHLVARFHILPDENGPKMELGKGKSIFSFGPDNFKSRFIERKITH